MNERLRIIGSVAAKDIVDAVKNKTLLAIVLGVAVLVLSGQAMPLLLKLETKPQVVVYDEGKSRLAVALKKNDDVRLRAVRLPQDLEQTIAEAGEPVLGLLLPADLDQRLEGNSPVELDGYLVHWVKAAEAAELQGFFEARLTVLAGQEVRIRTEGHAVYPAADAGGWPDMAAMTLIVAILSICGAVVPYLMIDEKETHTLDALLVSPASIGQVIGGKAIAGVFYGLLVAGVVYGLSRRLVVHWEVAILAAACAAFFAVAVGLLLGSLFDNAQSMSLWLGAALLVLLLPMLLSGYLETDSAGLVRVILRWMPSTLLVDAVKASFAADVAWGEVLLGLGVVLACTAGLLTIVVWWVRRSDR